MDNLEYKPEQFESLLSQHFQADEPDLEFLAQLKSSLIATATEAEIKQYPQWTSMNWRYALAAALLLIIGAVALIGPARVWAQIESWMAYLPGQGIVELSGTRALEETVAYNDEGISFQVEGFVASPEETLINIHIAGLPSNVSPSSVSFYIQWDDPDGQRQGIAMRKAQGIPTYPPCPAEGCPSDIQPDGFDLLFVYEPLPTDINQVQVQWLIYGMVPGAGPTDIWTLDIPLTEISIENVQDLALTGYSLLSAEDSQHEIKISVDNVFLGASGTVIDASIWVPKTFSLPNPLAVSLTSDAGERLEPIYFSNDLDLNGVAIQEIPPGTPGAPTLRVWPARWQFGPIDAQVSGLTLSIESISLYLESGFEFEVETGLYPEAGTEIPLDINFDVDGFPLSIDQARIVIAPASTQGVMENVEALEFTFDSDLSSEGRKLQAVWFSQCDGWISVEPVIDQDLQLSIGRLMLDPAMIRDGKVKVAVDSVVLELQGPWVINWDVPAETQ